MSKKIQVLTGTVEKSVNPMLETICGYTSEECINEIINPDMRRAVTAYAKAVRNERKGQWDMAKAISNMRSECREEFGDDGRLAGFLGLKSASQFSKLYRAGSLAKEAEKEGIKDLPPVSVVLELVVLEGKKYGNQKLLPALEDAIARDMTVAEAREYVRSFKQPSVLPDKNDSPIEEKEEEKETENSVKTERPADKDPGEFSYYLEITVRAMARLSDVDKENLKKSFISACATYGILEDEIFFNGID